RSALGRRYAENLGRVMAERYGLTPDVWAQANRRITADWDSYYADLNLGGDDGIAEMWEGLFRTTRALFRISGVPEPEKAELTALSRELPGLAARECDALYPEAAAVLEELDAAGLVLGVISHAISIQVRATLESVLPYFKGGIWGADSAERFEKDVQRYQAAALHARTAPENCLMLDDKIAPLVNARRAGMHSIQIRRDAATTPYANGMILPDLHGVVEYCLSQRANP
ncbi:MAG: HAD family hydrolase, partial [Chloroflexota bacterium]